MGANKILILSLLLLVGNTASAQSWETEVIETPEAYNGRQAIEDKDGNIAVCGTRGIAIGVYPPFLCKLDSAGNHLWHREYWVGIATSYSCPGLVEVDSTGYLLYGERAVDGAAQYDYFVIRTNYNGDTLWTKTWGTYNYREGLLRCFRSPDAGYYFLGYRENEVCADSVYRGMTRVIKTDSLCNQEWEKCFQLGFQPSATDPRGFAVTNDGDLLICGISDGLPFAINPFLLKLSNIGDTIFYRQYLQGFGGQGFGVTIDGYGFYYLSGFIADTSAWGFYSVLIKTDTLGNVIWTKINGNQGEEAELLDVGSNLQHRVTGAGGYYNSTVSSIGLIARYNTAGNMLWARAIDRSHPFYRISPTRDGGVLVTQSHYTSGKLYVAKIDSIGDVPLGYIDPFTDVTPSPTLTNGFELYPNPLSEQATVAIHGQQSIHGTFTIMNYLGEAVRVYDASTPTFTVQRQNLPAGLYVGVFASTDRSLSTQIKFIIQ